MWLIGVEGLPFFSSCQKKLHRLPAEQVLSGSSLSPGVLSLSLKLYKARFGIVVSWDGHSQVLLQGFMALRDVQTSSFEDLAHHCSNHCLSWFESALWSFWKPAPWLNQTLLFPYATGEPGGAAVLLALFRDKGVKVSKDPDPSTCLSSCEVTIAVVKRDLSPWHPS